MKVRGWGVRVVVMGGVVAVVAGCGDEPGPDVTPTPTLTAPVVQTPSPSPTPSPMPTALSQEEILEAIPDELHVEGFMSAVLFSQFFIELYPGMFTQQPEIALFEALSAADCGFCGNAIDSAYATQEAGAHTEGGLFSWSDDLLGAPRGGLRDDGFWYVTQPFSVTALQTYLDDGTLHDQEPDGTGEVGVKLSFVDNVWRVHGVEFLYDDE